MKIFTSAGNEPCADSLLVTSPCYQPYPSTPTAQPRHSCPPFLYFLYYFFLSFCPAENSQFDSIACVWFSPEGKRVCVSWTGSRHVPGASDNLLLDRMPLCHRADSKYCLLQFSRKKKKRKKSVEGEGRIDKG